MGSQPYKVVDLFSGAGGFSLGLEMPDRLNGLADLGYSGLGFEEETFETILAVESDDNTAETFRRNFDADVIEGDIRNVDLSNRGTTPISSSVDLRAKVFLI